MKKDDKNAATQRVHGDMPMGDMYQVGAPGLQDMPAGEMAYRSNESMQGTDETQMPAGGMNDVQTSLGGVTSGDMPRGDMEASGGALVISEMPSGAMTDEITSTNGSALREMPTAASLVTGSGLSLSGRWQLNVQLD